MAGNEVLVDCGEALGIADVGDLYATLLTEIAEGHTIKFDVSKIERIDGAALQLIYAYAKESISQGNPLNWDSPSEAFLRSARLLGLLSAMNLDDTHIDVAQ